MSLVLTAKSGGDFTPHPEGIHSAVCVDVMDLGEQEVEFQGKRSMKRMVRIVFESEAVAPGTGVRCSIDKRFSLSLHPKSGLSDFLGKWRGRPVVENETIDLAKLVGACCTLVVSHKQNPVGKTYSSIDAVTKPTKKVAASGGYDPVVARARYAEWHAKQSGGLAPVVVVPARSAPPAPPAPAAAVVARLAVAAPAAVPFPTAAPVGGAADTAGYDPEVGF